MNRRLLSAVLLLTAGATVAAAPAVTAQQAASGDDARAYPRPVVPPVDFRRAVEAGTRSSTGRPGDAYWQQRADYEIDAELDPVAGVLTARESITYHNRSPDTLTQVVLRLEQNVYAEGARRNRPVEPTGGLTLENVRVDGQAVEIDHPRGLLTLAELELPAPLPPGGTTRISLDFSFVVPEAPTFRQGNVGGELFGLAQWYPRMAVYDDVYGWDHTPYLGDGEFYLEYGDFDVAVTVPGGWVVGATGTLANPDEVLTPAAASRLESARTSDEPVRVLGAGAPEGLASPGAERVTWRFTAEDVRDFAFATSADYAWDARGVTVTEPADAPASEVPSARVLAQTFYRPALTAWRDEGLAWVAHTLEDLSRRIGMYPYPQLAIAEGPTGGMEYPMFIFNPSRENALGVTVHEGAHQWFPMVVGTMEAKHAWMDEGIVSYWDELSVAAYRGEEPDPWGLTGSYLRVAGTEQEVPLMRHTDLVSPYGARGLAAYTKPAVVLGALREVVGDEAFLAAFRDLYRSWAFKHPQPWDVFATFERHAGRDLDWFWRPLFFETDVLDHAVVGVEHENGRSRVMLRDAGYVILPTPVEVELADGSVRRLDVSAETWLAAGRRHDLVVDGRVVRVVLDPDAAYPDVDRSNNAWESDAPPNRSELR